jgi:tRNA/tmRNA/rRNA uracil-C5-methylase (TrmA/RlmC/RlmD family)
VTTPPTPTPTPGASAETGSDVPVASEPEPVGETVELEVGRIASGGGCVGRVPDGRVVFVRHALPGERVLAQVTSSTRSFLRADAVEILRASVDRVEPPCAHAGPGKCGGCDWQHVSLPAQRRLKSDLVEEQLRRVAHLERSVEVEEVAGAPDGLAWRTRMRFAVDRAGRVGLHQHRSHVVEPIERCPIATEAIGRLGVGSALWRGAHHLEVTSSPDGGPPVVSVETGRNRLVGRPVPGAGLVVNGRTQKRPSRVHFDVLGHRFEVSPGVFWQVHPAAATVLSRCVLDGLAPERGERVADLYSGAGLFTVPLALAVGPSGSVVAVERSGRAAGDAVRSTAGLTQVEVVRAGITPSVIEGRLGHPDLVVLDPAREGAGRAVMAALIALDPAPRRIAYVSCDPASFARDLATALEAGWTLGPLRSFDLFPMTEHVELVGFLNPPAEVGL